MELISLDDNGAATERPRRASDTASATRRCHIAKLEFSNPMSTFEPSELTIAQLSRGAMVDYLKCSQRATAQAARDRFLARHGPAADLPGRRVTSREIRKALRAAEMARWESF